MASAIQFGESQTIRYAGRDAEFRPMLDANKRPVRYPVDLKDKSMLDPVIGEVSFGGQRRAVVMGLRPNKRQITKDASIAEEKRQDGHPNRRFLQLYMRGDFRDVGGKVTPGGIFELPITDGREADDTVGAREYDGQTVNYLVTNEATGERVDAYLAKGWRYATCEDILKVWARADQNNAAAEAAKNASNPLLAIDRLASTLAAGIGGKPEKPGKEA